MNKLNIYSDAAYFASFMSDKTSSAFSCCSDDYLDFIINRASFQKLLTGSDLFFSDLPEAFGEIVKKHDLARFINKSINGSLHYHLNTDLSKKSSEELKEVFTKDKFQSFLMLQNHEKSQKMSDSYGVLNFPDLTVKNLKPLAPLFKICEKNLSKHDPLNDWKCLSSFFKPCNSILIADNYLLKNCICLDNNLDPLLKEMFYPMRDSQLPIELVIFSKKAFWNNLKNKYEDIDIKRCLDEIERGIHFYYPNIKVDVQIVSVDKEFHDRWILTNHYMIISAGGFDLVNNDDLKSNDDSIVHETHITAKYPQYYRVNDSECVIAFKKRIQEYKNIVLQKKLKVRCRLFDLVD